MHSDTKLLLTIDLGNSTAAYGLFEGSRLLANGHTESNHIPFFMQLIAKSGVYKPIEKVIISSVVPELTYKLKKSIKRKIGPRSVYVVGKDLKLKVPMRYDRRKLG